MPECVISCFGHDMLRESWMAGCPVPKGISEIDVMGCTPLPSQAVKPCGIAECPINLEAKVLHVHKQGKRWVNLIVEIVHGTVHKSLVEESEHGPLAGCGMLAMDPLFEVMIASGSTPETQNHRLYDDRPDFGKIERCPEDIGYEADWIGAFAQWMADEVKHGHLAAEAMQRALHLKHLWEQHRAPVANAEVKGDLTALLRKAVGK